MEKLKTIAKIAFTIYLFLLVFTPLIWIWCGFIIFAKVAGSYLFVIVAIAIIYMIIKWAGKED